MPDIAGKTVSKLHAFLRLPNETFVLVVDRQQQSLSDCMDEHGCVPEELKERLLSSLRVLHSKAVVHGSPRFDNVTVKPGSHDICWIDLQKTTVHTKYTCAQILEETCLTDQPGICERRLTMNKSLKERRHWLRISWNKQS